MKKLTRFCMLTALITLCTNSSPAMADVWLQGAQNAQYSAAGIAVNGSILSKETAKNSNKPLPKERKPSLLYLSSTARTKANLRSFVNKAREVDPTGADLLEREFASSDILGAIGQAMRGIGMNKNNVADAFAIYWVNAWSAAYADYSETSPAAIKAVSRQAAAGLFQSPEFASATDAQKQEMAEALLIQGALLDNFLQSAKGNPEAVQNVGKTAMQGAKTMGLDLDKMTLTEDGFVPSKKGSDAGEAVDAADPTVTDKALASADGAAANDNGGDDDEGLSTAQLALIAGAAGAGIAGVFLLGRSMGNKG